jgi:hypothetical protein
MFPVTRRRLTAWVIFQGADHRRFWRIFTRRGWRHCLVILPIYRQDADQLRPDVWSQVINPMSWGVQAEVYFERPHVLAQMALEEGATCVVKFPIDEKFDRDYVPRGLLTCVSMLKAILGVAAWYVWTPEHLARYLLRHGGKILERENHDIAVQGQKGGTGQGCAARAGGAGRKPSQAGVG